MKLLKRLGYALMGALLAYLIIAWLWMDLFNPFVPSHPDDLFDGTRYVMLVAAIGAVLVSNIWDDD